MVPTPLARYLDDGDPDSTSPRSSHNDPAFPLVRPDALAMIATRIAALSDASLARLARQMGAPLVRSGPPGLVAWYAALGRCAAAERMARRGGGDPGELRDAAERVLVSRTSALPLPERVALLFALRAQRARLPAGGLRDLVAALIGVLSPAVGVGVQR